MISIPDFNHSGKRECAKTRFVRSKYQKEGIRKRDQKNGRFETARLKMLLRMPFPFSEQYR